jgi:hypothetical protein
MTERVLRPSAYPMAKLALTFAAIALALASSGCSRSAEQKTAHAHPDTMDAAKALAASRGVPVLIDFYSPT